MGTSYVVFYTIASVVCVAILIMLLIHDHFHSTKQEKQIWFNRSLYAFMAYFVNDAFWAAVLGGALPRVRWLVVLLNLLNYLLLTALTYMWFMFMAASEKLPFRNNRKKMSLSLLPGICSLLVFGIAFILDPYFWINRAGELNALYYPLMISAPIIYIVIAFVLSMHNVRTAEPPDDRKNSWMLGIFPICVLFFGLIQMFFLQAPIFCFGCTYMLLFFYIQHMQMQISVDELTHLNNRGQINRYMNQLRYRDSVHVFVMMIDIDRFKQINDTYGHAEGDRALMVVSESLKHTCETIRTPIFLGRFGGDEFIIIIQGQDADNGYPQQFADTLRGLLAVKQQQNRLPYPLEVSIGYDELRSKADTMHECMIRADKKLYEEKQSKGTMR